MKASILFVPTLLGMVTAVSVIHNKGLLGPAFSDNNSTKNTVQNVRHAVQPMHPVKTRMGLVIKAPIHNCKYSSVAATAKDCNIDFRTFERIVVRENIALEYQIAPPGYALVQVAATSVNPFDWKKFENFDQHFPYALGTDFSGRVISTGKDCDLFVGDAVWGIADHTWQYHMYHHCSGMGRKPSNWTMLEAGASGVVVLTGYKGLRWAGAPWNNTPTVLVIGGSGGTGHVGIQLAKAFGAGKVISTCSLNNSDFVRNVGADEVIDYHKEDWWETLENGSIDIVYDCIGEPGTGDRAYSVLAPDGKFVTLLPDALATDTTSNPDVQQKAVNGLDFDTRREDYDSINAIAEEGKLKVKVEQNWAGLLREYVKAILEVSMRGHVVGKVGLVIDSDL